MWNVVVSYLFIHFKINSSTVPSHLNRSIEKLYINFITKYK